MIFRPGESCWRVERANRVAFLVDGAAYFAAFRRALIEARRSVIMVGWDFDTGVRLTPEDNPADGYPCTLLAFLNSLCERNRDLFIHVLAWDFNLIYAFERQPLPTVQFGWRGHKRVRFALDSEHPVGASHHQKIVVIDDQVAFVGGLDLTSARWDTPLHRPGDPRRMDADGKITRPMHDVQVAVDGAAATALAELARARWQGATGQILPPPAKEKRPFDPWPRDLVSDIEDTDVAIARTKSAMFTGEANVREIEALTLEAIGAARRTIYIENQYLTSGTVGRALGERLAQPDGPEVILVLPKDQGGWLEESSMGVLRGRLLGYLRSSDRHGRLRAYFPSVVGLPEDQCLGVHSKVLIVDDDFAKIGSANLSNRSMGLDSECDLAIEASGGEQGAKKRRALAALRTRLLAEHLGVEPGAFEARVAETGSIIAATGSFDGETRRLELLEPGPEPPVHLAVLDGLVCDPEQPIVAERLIAEFVPSGLRHPASRSLASYAAMLIAALAVGAAWRFTPLGDLLVLERLVEFGRMLRESPLAPLYVAAAYLGGGILFFPITVLITGTTLVFPPLEGFVYSMLGTLGSACMTYGIGRLIGRPVVERLLTPRLRRFRNELRRRSFAVMLGARLVPIGNFSLINLLAGALQIRFRAYFVANVLGILPGILCFTLFADRLRHTIENPRIENVLVLLLSLAAIVGALSLVRRGLLRARRSRAPSLREVKAS
jgi:phospholipase D1/2